MENADLVFHPKTPGFIVNFKFQWSIRTGTLLCFQGEPETFPDGSSVWKFVNSDSVPTCSSGPLPGSKIRPPGVNVTMWVDPYVLYIAAGGGWPVRPRVPLSWPAQRGPRRFTQVRDAWVSTFPQKLKSRFSFNVFQIIREYLAKYFQWKDSLTK